MPCQHQEPRAAAPTAAAPANLSEGSRLTAAHARITSLAPPPKAQGTLRQQALGRLGGTCAGFLGSNKFAVEAAADGRSRCQLRTCKLPLKIGELRLGKKPPSLRHGTAKKTNGITLHARWSRSPDARRGAASSRRWKTSTSASTRSPRPTRYASEPSSTRAPCAPAGLRPGRRSQWRPERDTSHSRSVYYALPGGPTGGLEPPLRLASSPLLVCDLPQAWGSLGARGEDRLLSRVTINVSR